MHKKTPQKNKKWTQNLLLFADSVSKSHYNIGYIVVLASCNTKVNLYVKGSKYSNETPELNTSLSWTLMLTSQKKINLNNVLLDSMDTFITCYWWILPTCSQKKTPNKTIILKLYPKWPLCTIEEWNSLILQLLSVAEISSSDCPIVKLTFREKTH